MFEPGRDTSEATLADAGETDLATAASAFTRIEFEVMARKILAAYHLGRKVFDRVQAADSDRYRKRIPDKAALREVSLHFAVPPATAGRWMTLGALLQDLPQVRAAFLAGDLSESRASLVAHAVCGVDAEQRAAAEEAALILAADASTNAVLSDKLDELVIALDPLAAAEVREEFAERYQDVRFSKAPYGQVAISATLGLGDARYLQSRITGLINHYLCADDPRLPGQQRADALVAITRGRTELECQCGSDTCGARANQKPHPEPEPADDVTDIDIDADVAAKPDAAPAKPSTALVPTKAAVVVVTDAPTLAGLTGEMVPFVPGYGVIDPAHARALATDATWTGMYREAQRFMHRTDPTDPDPHGRITMLRAGRPRKAGRIHVPAHLDSSSDSSGAIRVLSRPPNPKPIDPTGHGGLPVPPVGALDYEPTDAQRRAIALTDHHCRGPYCGRPVAECQLDHVRPYNHADPMAGGWTITDDLIPLCIPCHQFKHLDIWIPTLAEGRAVIWRHATTGKTIITWP
ncbi:HNH endonuclease signature motif containing protein [Gordonia sp. ABSL49_1]|uniref:HNH endonuclease signature motif containing protein n=1 Tax=Gordonia sp. ABSL49_1 TaxID=2920941 RepID=UPI001F0D0B8C|nr:HNH endonuclease signature motif containing protein [Gordonia sp. ABSL49_1]MCH5642132.1 HNH endonuclease [Gordonia sp. ABSL49_1]